MFANSLDDVYDIVEITVKEHPFPVKFTTSFDRQKCLVLEVLDEDDTRLQAGDAIVGINRSPCSGLKGKEVIQKLEEINLPVKLQVQRYKDLLTLTLETKPQITLEKRDDTFCITQSSDDDFQIGDELVCINRKWCGHKGANHIKSTWESTPFPLSSVWRRRVYGASDGEMNDVDTSERLDWQKGSLVEVFSQSRQKWTLAHISDRFRDEDSEWVEVQYWDGEEALSKMLEIDSQNLRAPADLIVEESDEEDNNEARKDLKEGDAIEIYSESRAQWFWGEVASADGDLLEVTWNIEVGDKIETLSKHVRRDSLSIKPCMDLSAELDFPSLKEDSSLLPTAQNNKKGHRKQPTLALKAPPDSDPDSVPSDGKFSDGDLSDQSEDSDEMSDFKVQSEKPPPIPSTQGASEDLYGRHRAGTDTKAVTENPFAGISTKEILEERALDTVVNDAKSFQNFLRGAMGETTLKESEPIVSTNNAEMTYLNKRLKMLEESHRDLEQRLRDSNNRMGNVKRERDEAELKIAGLRKKIKQRDDRIKVLENDCNVLKVELQKSQRSQEVIFNLKSRIQELEQQLLNNSTNKEDIEALKKKHEKEIDDLMDSHDQEIHEAGALSDAKHIEKITSLKGEIHDLEKKNSKLQALVDELRMTTNRRSRAIARSETHSGRTRNEILADEQERQIQVDTLRRNLEKSKAANKAMKARHDAEVAAMMEAHQEEVRVDQKQLKEANKLVSKLNKEVARVMRINKEQTDQLDAARWELEDHVEIAANASEEVERLRMENEEVHDLREEVHALQMEAGMNASQEVHRLRMEKAQLIDEHQKVKLELQRLKQEVKDIVNEAQEDAHDVAREEVERQLDEYRAVTAVQTSQLQNTIATLQQQVKSYRAQLEKREQRRQDAKRMKQSIISASVEIKWPKSGNSWGRSYVPAQMVVKHKELVLRSATANEKIPWDRIREIGRGDYDWQLLVVLPDRTNFKIKCPNDDTREKWLETIKRVCKTNTNSMTESLV